jgi:murein L,D-transpeptidase YafK
MFVVATLLAVLTAAPDTQPVIRLAGEPRAAAPARAKRLMADSILVDKSDRKLTLYYRGETVKTYDIALGRNPVGDKARRGDGRTPEGLYFIEGRNPQSKYHLSLRVSYPTPTQRARAAQRGISAGGDIMIHGLPDAFASVGALHRQQDWTEGCVAVTNEEIEEIWGAVPNGAKILIRP